MTSREVRAPEKPERTRPSRLAPQLAEEFVAWFLPQLRRCSGYVEFGSGGSTHLAADTVTGFILSVESSTEWIERTLEDPVVGERARLGDLVLHHADIGPTGNYGRPLHDPTPKMGLRYAFDPLLVLDEASRRAVDLVLVDGRFRVACALSVVLLLSRRGLLVFDDYVVRPEYHVFESVAGEPVRLGRAAVFELSDPDLQLCLDLLPSYLIDLR